MVNVNTIEFSMTEQSWVNGETPATLVGRPSCVGEPPNTASMCGTAPGSVSTTVTPKGENKSRTQATVAFQVAASVFHAGIVVCCDAIVERLVRESLLPGDSVTPVRLR